MRAAAFTRSLGGTRSGCVVRESARNFSSSPSGSSKPCGTPSNANLSSMVSDREGLAAPALGLHLRVHELEALLLEGVDEVESGAVEVDEALGIDVDLGPLDFEHPVLAARLIAVLDHVRHARAAASLDAQPYAGRGIRLSAPGELRLDLLRRAR